MRGTRSGRMHPVRILTIVLAVVSALAALVLWLIAIWTDGPDSDRFGMTGFLAFMIAFCSTAAATSPGWPES